MASRPCGCGRRAIRIPLIATGVVLCATLGLWACATSGPRPHPGIGPLWREYRDMPEARALAIAGDPDRVWVGGASGGHASREEAEEAALAECRKRRAARRLQVPCLLYASGDSIVWESW